MRLTNHPVFLVVLISALIGAVAPASAAQNKELPPGFDPKRHVLVEEVAPGMRGYGLTVFAGTKIEPFEVEVISMQHGFEPGQSVVWIRCPDARMQQSGPVQGMSGSPIFLWTADDRQRVLGQGGRMIGAFAYGHRLGKDCYAGVQPITQMLAAAARTRSADEPARPAETSRGNGSRQMAALMQASRNLGLTDAQAWRIKALAGLTGDANPPAVAPKSPPLSAGPFGDDAARHHMALPVAVGDDQQAALLEPYFAPYGFAAQAAPTTGSSILPHWIDPRNVKLEPGSVFSIPLVSGPLDMSAIGTTTEVLPDGTVLAFGHSFFAMGDLSVPMASGYVHFIQPSIQSSFKLGGTVSIAGTLMRDEQAAVIGRPGRTFDTSPVHVQVRWPSENRDRTFDYDVVTLNTIMPGLIGSVVSSSVVTETNLPNLNTVTIEGEIRFANGWTLPLRQVLPGTSSGRVGLMVSAPVAPLVENEFGEMQLESADISVTVEPQVRAAQIIGATLQQTTIQPGDPIVVLVKLLPYRDQPVIKRVEIPTPHDLPDGQYAVSIGGAREFYEQRLRLRPHLARSTSARELFEAVLEMYDIADDALYAMLQLGQGNNLALGRRELPSLPSSRTVLLAAEGTTRATPYADSVDVTTAVPWVVNGQVALQVNVAHESTDESQ